MRDNLHGHILQRRIQGRSCMQLVRCGRQTQPAIRAAELHGQLLLTLKFPLQRLRGVVKSHVRGAQLLLQLQYSAAVPGLASGHPFQPTRMPRERGISHQLAEAGLLDDVVGVSQLQPRNEFGILAYGFSSGNRARTLDSGKLPGVRPRQETLTNLAHLATVAAHQPVQRRSAEGAPTTRRGLESPLLVSDNDFELVLHAVSMGTTPPRRQRH
mmetsp:Transcript_35768/g.98575  ORF Transcript_35768/g.98575 Transcript_35768/m.98575 type:complete len:213 (-) Transcript_35768:978-1616(-)